MRRREFLSLPLALGASGCSLSRGSGPLGPERAAQALRRGAEFLWKQQSADGAWRSRTYGLLRGGESLTPFVLSAPIDTPDERRGKASEWLRSRINQAGAVGMSDPALPDYPNYSTAFTLRAFVRLKPDGWREDAARMLRFLRGQQFNEANGWKPEDLVYGAWGMGGEAHRPPQTGHVDLSMTRHVVEALVAAGVDRADPALRKAAAFVRRCHNFNPAETTRLDGGFFFSTVVEEANKAGARDGGYLSYGTATADGLRALLALGPRENAARIAAARLWLARNFEPDHVPGFDHHPDLRWRQGIFFYYAGAAAGVLSRPQLEQLVAELLQRQRPDGGWANDENLVKEDDPLIATSLALRALTAYTTT